VYNLLGDIISNLSRDDISQPMEDELMSTRNVTASTTESSLSETSLSRNKITNNQYKKIMEFLLQFVNKDK
jgi:hypothetical protein